MAIELPFAHKEPVPCSEAHHLLTEAHALGRREPDAFTVPLCPTHHRVSDHKAPHLAVIGRKLHGAEQPVNLWYAAAKLRWSYLRGAPEDCGI
jgi:hypothetical protein